MSIVAEKFSKISMGEINDLTHKLNTLDPELVETEEFSLAEAKEFAETLKLPFKPHDHQSRAFALATVPDPLTTESVSPFTPDTAPNAPEPKMVPPS